MGCPRTLAKSKTSSAKRRYEDLDVSNVCWSPFFVRDMLINDSCKELHANNEANS
ncbi:uncharacterized protein G2W53_028375 [Senna tora]|uniref:Uncharacterized protein n=1 Tax=Senna tora TaxID=362788 RepID=A0A834T351_9FABA|nr:uncharacterized protein G2W53_028375 [Senna tora]